MTRRRAEGLALLITLAWGSAFLFMKLGLNELTPASVLFLRSGIAFVVTLPLLIRHRAQVNAVSLMDGAVLGAVMTGLFFFLLSGLEHTTSTNAGFLTSLTVVFVPLIVAVRTRALPDRHVLLGLLLALCGICVLTLQGGVGNVGGGDALCVIGAFFYAVQICYTNHAVKRSDPMVIGVVQLGVATLGGLLLTQFTGGLVLPSTPTGIFSMVMLGVLCSGFGFLMQPVAQRHTSPTRVGMIFSLEPAFAALLGTLILREPFTAASAVGALLAFAGVVISGRKEEPSSRLSGAHAAE